MRATPPATRAIRPSFAGPLGRDLRGVRVAWCPDLGGLPLDRRVRAVLESRRRTFEELGCIVEEACPDLSGADEVFLTTRAWRVWSMLGPFLAKHRNEMKPEAIGEIERGSRLTAAEITRALVLHGEILERMRRFQERYEFLLCAVNQVPPFDATIDWPKEIEGVRDGRLHRLDAIRLLDHDHLPSRDLGAGRIHAGGAAGRHSDRGPLPRRSRRAADRARVRAGDRRRPPASADLPARRQPRCVLDRARTRTAPASTRSPLMAARWWRSLHPRARGRRSARRRQALPIAPNATNGRLIAGCAASQA